MGPIFLTCLLYPTPEVDYSVFPPPPLSPKGIRIASGLIKGMAFTYMLQKRMTHEQVLFLLGEPSFQEFKQGFVFEAYGKYGIQIFWPTNAPLEELAAADQMRFVWALWRDWWSGPTVYDSVECLPPPPIPK
jgi:hypothetical protein